MGAEILVKALQAEGVQQVWGYPGGAVLYIYDALYKQNTIQHVLVRHEQAAVHAADGFARATGEVGVALVTSGPGVTNAITGIATAYMDSIPMVIVTGQVPTAAIGLDAFQECDTVGITRPIVKHNFLVKDASELAMTMKKAFHIARTGRPGPVVVDIPKDVSFKRVPYTGYPESVEMRSYNPVRKGHGGQIRKALQLLLTAKRPYIYTGGGVLLSNASPELRALVDMLNFPVTNTLMGLGAFPANDRRFLGMLGMHGTIEANNAMQHCDVLIAIGARFDDRVIGNPKHFAQNERKIVHIDIDNSEINKNKSVRLPILSDIKYALSRLNKLLDQAGYKRTAKNFNRLPAWYKQINEWKAKHPLSFKDTDDVIQPQHVIRLLCEMTKGEAIITTGVGQHQMWAGQFYNFDKPRTFITSAGLGSMGFGYPSAMGAKVGAPHKQVVDIDGDGSFLMNVQELATAHIEGIAAKAIILNNQHLGMVVQWEDRFHGGNRGHTFLGDPKDLERVYPNYVDIAKGFGVPCERVLHKKDLPAAMKRMLDSKEAYLLDVMVPFTEHVLPMIPAGKTYKDIITE